jgi:hypothetical protein
VTLPDDSIDIVALRKKVGNAIRDNNLDEADNALAQIEQLQDSTKQSVVASDADTKDKRGRLFANEFKIRQAIEKFHEAAIETENVDSLSKQWASYATSELSLLVFQQIRSPGDTNKLLDYVALAEMIIAKGPEYDSKNVEGSLAFSYMLLANEGREHCKQENVLWEYGKLGCESVAKTERWFCNDN